MTRLSLRPGTGLGIRDDADSGEHGAEHRGRGQSGAGVEDRHGLEAAQRIKAGLSTRGGGYGGCRHCQGLSFSLCEVMRLLLK